MLVVTFYTKLIDGHQKIFIHILVPRINEHHVFGKKIITDRIMDLKATALDYLGGHKVR